MSVGKPPRALGTLASGLLCHFLSLCAPEFSAILFETVFIYFVGTNLLLGPEEARKNLSHLAGGGRMACHKAGTSFVSASNANLVLVPVVDVFACCAAAHG